MSDDEARALSPLTLAFVGDAVHTAYIRTRLVSQGDNKAQALHREASRYVNAAAQSRVAHELAEELSEEESAVYKRGRNAKSATVPKHADVADYRHATGFEALIGYLFLAGKTGRMEELLARSYEIINEGE